MGAFDQDIDAKTSMANPQLYKRGIQGLEYSRTVFWTYMLDGLYQSAVVFFVPFVIYYFSTAASTQGYGMDAGVELGTTVAASAVITVTIFIGINNSYQTALMVIILVVSALLLYVSYFRQMSTRLGAYSPSCRSGSQSTALFLSRSTTWSSSCSVL